MKSTLQPTANTALRLFALAAALLGGGPTMAFGQTELASPTQATAGTAIGPIVDIGGRTFTVVTVSATPARTELINLSLRGAIGPGETLITGFVVAGETPVSVLIRAAGPGLTNMGVTGAIENPKLRLLDASGTVVAQNDDWMAEGRQNQGLSVTTIDVGAFPLPTNSRDAAARVLLQPGAYTLLVSGATSADAGDVLAEVYAVRPVALSAASPVTPVFDAINVVLVTPTTPTSSATGTTSPNPGRPTVSRLVNLSARGRIDSLTGLIGGFVVSGPQPKRFLIRVAGPALAAFGVPGAASDPTLTVTTSGNAPLAFNDDWDADEAQAAAINEAAAKSGAFPFATGSRDAAAIVTLANGNYTVIAREAAGSGDALLEVYEIPD